MQQEDLLRLLYVVADPRVPLPVRHRPPEVRFGRAVAGTPEIKRGEAGSTHRVQVKRKLLVRPGEADELGYHAVVGKDATDGREAE